MRRSLGLRATLLLLGISLGACQKKGSPHESQLAGNSAEAMGRSLEYSSGRMASVDAAGQLQLPGLNWTGRLTLGSVRYEVLPVE